MKALTIILILLNLLHPVAGFVHAITDATHAGDMTMTVIADSDEDTDTHHPDHAPFLSRSEYPFPANLYHHVTALLADDITRPPDFSLHLLQVVVSIFYPPQNCC